MPKRKHEMLYYKIPVKGRKESIEAFMFRSMVYYINWSMKEEEELISMLNQCSTEVLQAKDNDGNYLLYYACWSRYETLALLMLEKYPNALLSGAIHLLNMEDENGEIALFYACRQNQVKLIKALLNKFGTNINHQNKIGQTALHICCLNKNYECIELFLNDKNVDLILEDSDDGYTSFDTYVSVISNETITNLTSIHNVLALFAQKYSEQTSKIKNVNNRRFNWIHAYVRCCWKEFYAFDYLFSNGYAANIMNQQDELGNTPLHYACRIKIWNKEIHCLKLMNQPGLLLNVRNDKGRTPFHAACFCLRPSLIDYLQEHPGVNINMVDKGGENALHHMIQSFIKHNKTYGSSRCIMGSIHVLLKKNPHLVSQKNRSSETPYDYACKWNSISPDQQAVYMNGKLRKKGFYADQIDQDFWSTLVKTLQDYQTESKNRMYKYFMESITK